MKKGNAYEGTIIDAANFDAAQDAREIEEAMSGILLKDCDKVADILCGRSNAQRQKIKAAYFEIYKNKLEEEVDSEIRGDMEDLALALLLPPVEFDAHCLRNAFEDEKVQTVVEILMTRTKAQLMDICNYYGETYNEICEESVERCSDDRLVVAMLRLGFGEADETAVNNDLADADAKKLRKLVDGQDSQGFENAIYNLTANFNLHQLARTANRLNALSDDLVEELKNMMTDEVAIVFCSLGKCDRSIHEYFAGRLHWSMEGIGTDNETLIRIVVSRCETDLATIRRKFNELYEVEEESLIQFIKGDTWGSYFHALKLLVKGNIPKDEN